VSERHQPGSTTPPPFAAPRSSHRDASWYRQAATKTSAATPDSRVSRVTDDDAWAVVSHTVAGILLYGGLGWLLGTWLGHRPLFIAGGVLFGVALSLFMLFRRLEFKGSSPEKQREDRTAGPRSEVVAPMPVPTGTTTQESSRVR
jgi:ATP synthase protein I